MSEDKKSTPPPAGLLGTGAARAAATAKAPSSSAIRAYSREYDTISPAGKNVHERYAKGGMVRRGYGKARGA